MVNQPTQRSLAELRGNSKDLPFMVFADQNGYIYEHPYLRMVGFSGPDPVLPGNKDLIKVPPLSKFFFIPDCHPIGLDPRTGYLETVPSARVGGQYIHCRAVSVFLEPGLVRTYLPAVDYSPKSYVLPTWAYTAVGFRDGSYWAPAFLIEHSPKWDPRNYDDRDLIPAIEKFKKDHKTGPLVRHLINCATSNHCFAAKNLFLRRWEAPLPVSRKCNSACLGCLSLQADSCFEPSHRRITFTPSKKEIVDLAVQHLEQAPEPILSFGQGCEGEPLTEHVLIAESIQEIRKRTKKGTINLNTNGSDPQAVKELIRSGLDSIRISLNSARPDYYKAYFRPKGYEFEDVLGSITLSTGMGVYTMINYLVFPGITDQIEELTALEDLISRTGANFIHLKNLNIDPKYYIDKMPSSDSPAIGIKAMADHITGKFPGLKLGYFNQPVR